MKPLFNSEQIVKRIADSMIRYKSKWAAAGMALVLGGGSIGVSFLYHPAVKAAGPEEDSEAEETTAAQPAVSQSREERAVKFIDALGGVDNFKNIDACITRLRLSLVDQHKINEEQLKSLGAKGIVKIGNDGLQVVLGPEAELVAEAMKQKVK